MECELEHSRGTVGFTIWDDATTTWDDPPPNDTPWDDGLGLTEPYHNEVIWDDGATGWDDLSTAWDFPR